MHLVRTLLRFTAALSGLLLSPMTGRAHAPAEVTQLVSTTPSDVIVATNRGLIFGNLQTRAFSLLCGDGFGISVATTYRAALLPSGRLLLASSGTEGMRFTDDRGCTVQNLAALRDISTPFMLQHPLKPEQVYVATYGNGQSGVSLTTNNGDSFTKLLSVGDDDFVGSLVIAPGAVDHLYAGIVYFPANAPEFSFFVAHSADGGKTWDRNEVPLTNKERDLAVLAVNPMAPEQIVVHAVGEEPSMGERVLFSRDGGKTFTSPLSVRVLRTATFSADGKLLYIGGVDGLMRAEVGAGALTFVPVASTARVSHLQQLGGQLLAGGYYQGLEIAVDGVGSGAVDNPSFTRWFDFNEVQTHVDCPAPSPVNSECAMLFRDWLLENPVLGGADAGTPDAGVSDAGSTGSSDAGLPDSGPPGGSRGDAGDASMSSSSNGKSDGGCSMRHGEPSSTSAGFLLALALLSRRRRPTRRTPQPSGSGERSP